MIFGFSFMFSKIALTYANVLQLMGLRFLVAAIIFIVLRLIKVIDFTIELKDLKILIPIAFFQPVLYFLGETYGISYSSSSMAGIVISLIPVTTAIIAYFTLNEVLGKMQTLFLIVSLLGIGLISYMALADFEINMMIGLIFLFVAVLSTSIYNVLSRKASTTYSPVKITYIMMIFAAIVFNTIGLIHSQVNDYAYFAPFLNIRFDMSVLFLGAVSSIFAFFLMNYTLSKMPATQFSLFVNSGNCNIYNSWRSVLNEQIFMYQILDPGL